MREAIGDEMRDVLNEVLQYPDAPPEVDTPEIPAFDSDTLVPEPLDSTPPSQPINFDNVPDIPVQPDNTGGIDLRNADPTDQLPHDPDGYKPIPGQETGGERPATKPIDTPVPSNWGVPQLPADATPHPGSSTGEPPSPGGSISPPPAPELPFQDGSD